MDDSTPDVPQQDPSSEPSEPTEPPPPFQPDPDLIGYLERGQKGGGEKR